MSTREINQSNFDDLVKNSDLSLVDVWAPWCGPCKQLSPIIDEVSHELSGKAIVGKLNADENMEICKEFNVRNIPTLLLFKNGEVVDRMTGLKPKKEILELVEKHS